MTAETTDSKPRQVALPVVLRNLAYFSIEFGVAVAIGSVSLFADSVDFIEDAFVNLLIAVAVGWSARNRAWLGMALAGILLVPGLVTVWTAWEKSSAPVAPEPLPLSLAGLGALAVNMTCALLLTRCRHHSVSLTRAAFLSARNDTLANVAIIAAGLVTASVWSTARPDLIMGLAIATLNTHAAREIWTAAREEHRAEAYVFGLCTARACRSATLAQEGFIQVGLASRCRDGH